MIPFSYRAPTSLKEAVLLFNNHDLRVRPLACGTDLLVQLRSGRVLWPRMRPARLRACGARSLTAGT